MPSKFCSGPEPTDGDSLEAELEERIDLLAQQGVDTSNDEELALALQEMLDREYHEELSLRLCAVCVSACRGVIFVLAALSVARRHFHLLKVPNVVSAATPR